MQCVNNLHRISSNLLDLRSKQGGLILKDLIINFRTNRIGLFDFITPVSKLLFQIHSYIKFLSNKRFYVDDQYIKYWDDQIGIALINSLCQIYVAVMKENIVLFNLKIIYLKKYFYEKHLNELNILIQNSLIDGILPIDLDFEINVQSISKFSIQHKFLEFLLTTPFKLCLDLQNFFQMLDKVNIY